MKQTRAEEWADESQRRARAMNIALITLDSLRYDVAVAARTPRLDAIFDQAGAGRWRKVYAAGDYTLPSHVSVFQGGRLPSNFGDEPIYNHKIRSAFRMVLPWRETKECEYLLPHAPNLVRAYAAIGYRTVGIGGVGWFDTRYQTTNLWADRYFDEFVWREEFHEDNPASLEAQIDCAQSVEIGSCDRLLFFLNCSSTHTPFRGRGLARDPEVDFASQVACAEYVDEHLPRLLDLLPRPCHVFLFADHGECMGEDGHWGHGFFHPKVLEVPMIHFVMW